MSASGSHWMLRHPPATQSASGSCRSRRTGWLERGPASAYGTKRPPFGCVLLILDDGRLLEVERGASAVATLLSNKKPRRDAEASSGPVGGLVTGAIPSARISHSLSATTPAPVNYFPSSPSCPSIHPNPEHFCATTGLIFSASCFASASASVEKMPVTCTWSSASIGGS